MQESVTLRSPILIDGEMHRELTYDIDLIMPEQFIAAEQRSAAIAMQQGQAATKISEADAGFHLYLGVMAILAVNPGYTVEDIERVKGPDLYKIMRIGRNFMIAAAEEDEEGDFALTAALEDEAPDDGEEESYLQAQD